MKQYLAVQSTMTQVPNLEVNVDTVYLRSNIQRIETEEFSGWQYDEIQYTLREYHEFVGSRTEILEADNADLWFENLSLKSNMSAADQEIANLWYLVLSGGGANV